MTAGGWTALSRSLTACLVALPVALAVGSPAAQAKNGDTHITAIGANQTIDRNGEPVVWDRGRELGMMNRIDRVPA